MEKILKPSYQLFKPVEELEFTDDFMFCTVLEENKDICKEIIELLLNIKVEDVEYVNKQQSFTPRYETKGIRLDVFLKIVTKLSI